MPMVSGARAQAFALAGQVEMDIDPSLPLDNLDQNILCADALFTDWPETDAIVGNPPFLGKHKIRGELGVEYLERLQQAAGFDGVVDLVCHWFRRTHNRLATGARAGLVGTSGIRVGKAREASLDYIVANGGTITNAVSSRLWPGEAALNVSMVNWVKGDVVGPHSLIIDDQILAVERIPTHLQLHADVSDTRDIAANDHGTTRGVALGHDAFRTGSTGFPPAHEWDRRFVRPIASGDDMLRGLLSERPEHCIYLSAYDTELEAEAAGRAFVHLKTHFYPWLKEHAESGKGTSDYATWFRKWWKPQKLREEFFIAASKLRRIIVCASPQSRPIFAFISMLFVPSNTLQLFAFEDDYSFGIIQSSLHWGWTRAKGGRVTERIRYTNEVWRTFPWPQEPTDIQVGAVAAAGRNLRRVRDALMTENRWSLRALYQAAEVEGFHPIKEAQAALDAAANAAYGLPDSQDPIEFLLELNQLVTEDEEQGRKVRGPGLPDHLDPKNALWLSVDCIQPPAVER